MNKVKSSKATTKRLVASGIMLFGGFLTFVNKPQDVHADDGVAPIKETNTTAKESSNVAVLKTSVKSAPGSESKIETAEKDAEGVEHEVGSEATEKAGASARTAVATETAEAASLTASVVTPAPTDGTATASVMETLEKTYVINAKTYKFTGVAGVDSTPMFRNKVDNRTDGGDHTYSFNLGTSSTSSYYLRDASGLYHRLAGVNVQTGKTDNTIWKSFTTAAGVEVKETVTFTSAGLIEHTVTMKNIGTTNLNDYSYGVMLDTMLDDNDNIEIYASGTGGAFLKNSSLTLYATGLQNSSVFAGEWDNPSVDILNRVPVTGNSGSSLVHDVDSAIQYETGKVNLAPGESYTFKFAERLHTGDQTLGRLTLRYVNTKGDLLSEDRVLINVVGESYTITPEIMPGYAFQKSDKPLTGVYTEAEQTVTLVYTDEILPDTEDTKTPAKPVTPAKPTTSVKPAVPTKKTTTPSPVATPKSNIVLPQTGEKSGITASVIGVGLLATLSLFGLAKLRRRENG